MSYGIWKKAVNFSAFAFCSLNMLSADSSSTTIPPDQRPYDYDLFSKDKDAIFINAELLYRTVLESGLEYVCIMNQVPSSSLPAINEDLSNVGSPAATVEGPEGNYRNGDFKWKPGFRASIGYFNAAKYWDVQGQYTWFESRGFSGAGKPDSDDKYLQPTVPTKEGTSGVYAGLVGTTLDTTISSATADTHYRFNLVDALVNRNFFPNPHLRIRVTGGITGTWQNQTFTTRYFMDDTTYSKTAYKWGYWGFGLRGGANADWYWGKDFYFTAKMTGAATVGRYTNHTKTVYLPTTSSTAESLLSATHYADYRGAFNVNFLLGPSWQKSFDYARFELYVGYEIDSWFNLAEFRTYDLASNNNFHMTETKKTPITMNGVSLRFTTYF